MFPSGRRPKKLWALCGIGIIAGRLDDEPSLTDFLETLTGDERRLSFFFDFMTLMTDLKDNPEQIAEYLIRENDLETAIHEAFEGTAKAQREGDNYTLSIWREVKAILRTKQQSEKADGAT